MPTSRNSRSKAKSQSKVAAPKRAGAASGQRSRPKPKQSQKPKGAPKSAAVGKMIASVGKGLLPPPFNLLPLEGLGELAGNAIGTLLGLGEYDLKANSIVLPEGNDPPFMHSEHDTARFTHREFIGDVFSAANPGDYKVQYYPVSFGATSTFPWGHNVAQCFQEWYPMGIVFEFVSATGYVSSASTPAIGTVMMSTDYDSFDTNPFPDEVAMLNNFGTTSKKTTETFCHPIECDPSQNVLGKFFTRTNTVPLGQPPQLYDLATFAIASVGCPTANQNLGKLWVTYDMGCRKATTKFLGNSAVQSDQYDLVPNTGHLLNAPVPDADNSLGGTIDQVNDRYYFPPSLETGTYQVTYYSNGAAVPYVPLPTPATGNCALVSLDPGGLLFTIAPANAIAGPNTTTLLATFFVRITGQNAYFRMISSGSLPVGSGYLVVTQVDAQIAP